MKEYPVGLAPWTTRRVRDSRVWVLDGPVEVWDHLTENAVSIRGWDEESAKRAAAMSVVCAGIPTSTLESMANPQSQTVANEWYFELLRRFGAKVRWARVVAGQLGSGTISINAEEADDMELANRILSLQSVRDNPEVQRLLKGGDSGATGTQDQTEPDA